MKTTTFGRIASALALAAMAVAPASAQFGGLNLKKVTRDASNLDADGCPKGKKKSIGGALLGGIAGQIAGNAVSKSGVGAWVQIPDVEGQLTKSIACKLDPQEQIQAAEATLTATRSTDDAPAEKPPIGSSASWNSNTREGVSGSSTVVGRRDASQGKGQDCLTVVDVIIVDGEETRATKQMCRSPGSKRYEIVT
ncbi:MAG: hypothetical protein H6918_10685 [Sphingomonadaceae bacterium]|nr:hypothetical protein [Sphingomonadaceae bacterium]